MPASYKWECSAFVTDSRMEDVDFFREIGVEARPASPPFLRALVMCVFSPRYALLYPLCYPHLRLTAHVCEPAGIPIIRGLLRAGRGGVQVRRIAATGV